MHLFAFASRPSMLHSRRHLENRTLILLSNREPYEHVRRGKELEVRRPAGGLVSALDPTMRETRGIWVAWGSGDADHESADEHGRIAVPPEDPSYVLRRVWLDESDVDGYYLGFANSSLWPLCHLLIQHYDFRMEDWERYELVNRRFAEAVADEASRASGRPLVWIQDYHFALVANELRRLAPSLFVHQFWHIPFPPPDIVRVLPTKVQDAVLRGLLGNDLMEFHTERYASNFLNSVNELVPDARVDLARRTVTLEGRTTRVGAFPISIDVERYESLATTAEGVARAKDLRERYAGHSCQLGVSVDRVDYTKGIPERLRALDMLWSTHPELRHCFTMLIVATPSRSDLATYRDLEKEVVRVVAEINERHGDKDWTPIVLINENVNAELLASIYRSADLCLVSSLQDGMNLVAKEFVACQVDERGVLVLSRFTGAAEEIEGAVLVNPFNVDGFVAGIRRAIRMSPEERRERMHAMRMQLRRSTIFDWLDAILARCAALMDERDRRAAERETELPVPRELGLADGAPLRRG